MTNLVEIKIGAIDTTSLELVQEKRCEAYARTTEGQRVKYIEQITQFELNDPVKFASEIAHRRYFVHPPDANLIVDSNAIVVGGELWRRGRNLETVQILTGEAMDQIVDERIRSNFALGESMRPCLRTAGIWQIIED